MTNLELNKCLADYVKLQDQEDNIKLQKDALKEKIILLMGDEQKYDNGAYVATRTLAEGFKYTDEVGMIKILKDNGYGSYVKEKVDTTSTNKFLKSNSTLTESLINGNYITKTLTEKLSVKEI